MITACLDATVMIDLLRLHLPASRWLRQQNQSFGMTPVTGMECVRGGNNKVERQRAARLMQQFDMTYLTDADMDWAMGKFLVYGLSHGIGVADCLIASASARLNMPLFTHNLKHLRPILGQLAIKPY